MAIPYSAPSPGGSARASEAERVRSEAAQVALRRPHALTRANRDEADFGDRYPANFTKGLRHDSFGLLQDPGHYRLFVEAVNSEDSTRFENHVVGADDASVPGAAFGCTRPDGKAVAWRGWESPRAGHVYDLEGPDAGAVGMAPAPRLGSSELAFEMAEVYALALLRDVPFSELTAGGGSAGADRGAEVVGWIAQMPFVEELNLQSSTGDFSRVGHLNLQEHRRRYARTFGLGLSPCNAFRGSTRGAQAGPYVSQFLLIGAPFAGLTIAGGRIPYGSVAIDQRSAVHAEGLDHMTCWRSWLDVQNGADFRKLDRFEQSRRFISTPRDLATYVHFDALYEAYLNAALIMLALEIPTSGGFPEKSPSGRRTPFATFGGPHVLSLVTEVATRCLKAVRRQKFNHHRRARPEALAGRLALVRAGAGAALGHDAGEAVAETLEEMPDELLDAVVAHNDAQNAIAGRPVACADGGPNGLSGKAFAPSNLLLPMAFPEGSPMHPSYGAGHATVAGGCVTMLKAFFEMFEDGDSYVERCLESSDGDPIRYVPDAGDDFVELRVDEGPPLTVQGELDKLAANISIGRNMAGVHYYSDYYDSLRMGERVAVGILMEQAPTYGEEMSTTFTSFDGDHIEVAASGGGVATLSVLDRSGEPVAPRDWWLRHVAGEDAVLPGW